MLTALIASSAALAAVVVAVLVVRARSAGADRRFDIVLGQLDEHMRAISQSLQGVVERAAEARAAGVADLELTVDFAELLRRLAAEAAARTGAQAAAVHVRGPDGTPASASFGADEGIELLGAPAGPGARPFRAVTVNWSYGSADEHADHSYTSAIVVPVVEAGVETGSIAAYAVETGAFGATHMVALEALAAEAAPAIASARRFADAERSLTDPATGLRNRAGYESALERAVAHAQASGVPLSLLVLAGAGEDGPSADDPPALRQLADLLLRLTRATDVVCRRAPAELGIVLPDTAGDAARRFYTRLREEAAHAVFSPGAQVTFAAGLVEWRPNEPTPSFDARAAAAVGRSRIDALELGGSVAATQLGVANATGEAFDERLAREVERARRLRQPLALLVLEVGAGSEGERREEAVDRAVESVQAHVAAHLSNGDVSARIGPQELAVILPGSRAVEAEQVFAALRIALDGEPSGDPLTVSAGITEVAEGDDAADVSTRAEHALWRARQAGVGTAVVALASDDRGG